MRQTKLGVPTMDGKCTSVHHLSGAESNQVERSDQGSAVHQRSPSTAVMAADASREMAVQDRMDGPLMVQSVCTGHWMTSGGEVIAVIHTTISIQYSAVATSTYNTRKCPLGKFGSTVPLLAIIEGHSHRTLGCFAKN